jgi:hypothetical protein
MQNTNIKTVIYCFVLLVVFALWLAISSVEANAIHTFAKNGYVWSTFGSVSFSLLIFCSVVLALTSYLLYRVWKINLSLQAITFCFVVTWILMLAVFTIVGDEILNKSAIVGGFIWVLEIIVVFGATVFLTKNFWLLKTSGNTLVILSLAFVYASSAKAILLAIFPGVSVRF